MCDEVYYNNPADKMGSVGIYWANILNKNGDIDPETGGTWHIVYDPESYDKNRFVRDLAEENDDTKIKEELIADGKVFRDYIKSRRPKVTDDMLHGKMFDVKDLEGILVVGQATMQETFNRIVALAGKKGKTGLQSAAHAAGIVAQFAAEPGNILSTHKNNSINMKEKFPKIFALLGVEAMECEEDGTFFNASLLETLEAKIGEMEQAQADAKALAEQLTADKEQLQTQLTEKDAEHLSAIESLNQEHATAIEAKDKALADAQEAHTAALAAKDEEIKTLGEAVENYKQAEAVNAENTDKLQKNFDGAQAALATAEQTIAERDQQISDLNARITELENDPGQEPQAGASPENNGEGAQVVGVGVSQYVYDPSLSYEENGKREAQWKQEHGM